MFAYVSGKLVEKRPTRVVIDVQGIGYAIHIPASSFDALPSTGETARLLTYYYVREDAATLFGFASADERTLFETMLAVSGVGPRLALAALSAMKPGDLRQSILNEDAGLLTRIPGVGRKKAERLIVELKDRVAQLDGMDDVIAGDPETGDRKAARADALSALESLGFNRAASERLVRRVLKDNPEVVSAEDLIRLALRQA